MLLQTKAALAALALALVALIKEGRTGADTTKDTDRLVSPTAAI